MINKSILYLSVLFVLLVGLIFFGMYRHLGHNVVYEKNGLQFERIYLDEVVRPRDAKYVILLNYKDSERRDVYYFDGLNSNYEVDYDTYTVRNSTLTDNDLFVMAVDGSIEWKEQTASMDHDELTYFWTSPENNFTIKGRKLIQYNFESGIWGFLDDSPFVLSLFILSIFLFLWLIDWLAAFFIGNGKKIAGLTTRMVFIVIILYFTTYFKPSEWHLSSIIGILTKDLLAILPTFILFQWVLLPKIKNFSVPDKELIKFTFLALSIFLFTWLGVYLGITFDALRLTNVVRYTPYYLPGFLSSGIIISFILGNLLNNIRKNVRSMLRSRNLVDTFRQEVLSSSAEMHLLRSSINPHFLYNSLNSIASLASSDPVKTENMAFALSDFYKYVNNKEEEDLSSVEDELAMLSNYLEIEQIRFGELLHLSFSIDEKTRSLKIPRFTLQPLVENAIKYGYHYGEIAIKISTLLVENELLIMIFDNGKPFEPSMHMGFGLKSINRKLKLLFPERHALEFVNDPEKHVLISIELNETT